MNKNAFFILFFYTFKCNMLIHKKFLKYQVTQPKRPKAQVINTMKRFWHFWLSYNQEERSLRSNVFWELEIILNYLIWASDLNSSLPETPKLNEKIINLGRTLEQVYSIFSCESPMTCFNLQQFLSNTYHDKSQPPTQLKCFRVSSTLASERGI